MEKLGLRVPAAASYGQERGGASSSHSSEVRYSLARLPNVGREFHTFAIKSTTGGSPNVTCVPDSQKSDGVCDEDFGGDYALDGNSGEITVATRRPSGKLHVVEMVVVVTDLLGLQDEAVVAVGVTGEP